MKTASPSPADIPEGYYVTETTEEAPGARFHTATPGGVTP